jgi:serine phosphatase RsbU (regulator of sigma subunit)
MSGLEAFRNHDEMSDDAILIFENDVLVKWNKAASEILKDVNLKNHKEFNLSGHSPKFQPCGKLSVEKEAELKKIATSTGYNRFEWTLENSQNEQLSVEVTFSHRNYKKKSSLLMALRDINQQKKNLQLLEHQRKEIMQKNEEIEIQREEIGLQKEQVEIQRDLAEKQRDEISVQKKALTDSIRYASRIQSALLPESESFCSVFSDYFILNKPKDIVSGDFYWFSQKNGIMVVAVADCTGHGVPGALMSVLGMKFLDEIVNDAGITQPDRILNHLKERIIKSLGQTGKAGETTDGMDIALVSIDLVKNSLQFAGAFNPLYIIRNNKLREIKGDRMPLGFQMRMNTPFTNHEILIEANDSIYLFTDGYADQYGWRSNKKLNVKNFRELIMSIQNVPMKAQKILLENDLKNWMGDLEQIDDIMILGIKI